MPRALHRLAEALYEMLEEEGYWDEPTQPRRSRRRRSRSRSSTTRGMVRLTARRAYEPKKKRKVSAYQKEFGRQLKKLKKKHPRTPVTRLMKRAHAATKRARRGK
jgi:hypothetical protein